MNAKNSILNCNAVYFEQQPASYSIAHSNDNEIHEEMSRPRSQPYLKYSQHWGQHCVGSACTRDHDHPEQLFHQSSPSTEKELI
jgi:hypothetical protein